MWIVLILLAIAAVASLFAFPAATFVLVPLLVVMVAAIARTGFQRRRKQLSSIQHHREKADSGGVDFTEHDRKTLSH